MTELDPLTEQEVHLFLRIDAAMPTDPVLRAAAEFWLKKRQGKVRPSEEDMTQLPQFIRPHVFEAHLAINGDRRWIVSRAGNVARLALGIEGHEPGEVADKRIAVRLRHLFDLVSHKDEPYSVMFEVKEDPGKPHLVEVYAAPLATPERPEHHVIAVLTRRTEAHR